MQDHLRPAQVRSKGWPSDRWKRLVSVAALVLALGAGGLAAPGRAVAQTTDAATEAKQHYEEGTKAYSLGEFPRAITEFKAAYNAKAEPTLLFNIAQSYRLAGDANQALFFYRSYLRNKPDAINRRDVDRRIKELEKQIADGKGSAAAAAGANTGAGVAPVPATGTTPPTPAVGAASTAPAATAPGPAAAPSVAPTGPSPGPAASAPVQPLPSATSTQPPPVTGLAPPPAPAAVPAPGPTTVVATSDDKATEGSPFYKKWWFWTGVGVVAVIGVAAAVSASRQKVDHDDFGGPYGITY